MENIDKKYIHGFLVKLTSEQFENLSWVAHKERRSKSELLRDMIDEMTEVEAQNSPDRLEQRKKAKIDELTQLQSKIEQLEAQIKQAKEVEPVKSAKFDELWENAVGLTMAAIDRKKDNIVASGNAAYMRSFGFKVSTVDILDEAYRRIGRKQQKED